MPSGCRVMRKLQRFRSLREAKHSQETHPSPSGKEDEAVTKEIVHTRTRHGQVRTSIKNFRSSTSFPNALEL